MERISAQMLESSSFLLSGTLPSAIVLVGTEERELHLAPQTWPHPGEGGVTTFLGPATTQTWRWILDGGFELELVRTRLTERLGVTLRASIANRSSVPVRLRSLHVMTGGELVLTPLSGGANDWTLAPLHGSGDDRAMPWTEERLSLNERTRRIWKSYNMPIPFELPGGEKANDGRWRKAPDGFSIVRAGGREALVMQAVGPGEAEFAFDYQVLPDRLHLEIAALFSEVLLAPGEVRATDELLLLAGGWQESCEHAFRWVAATHGARSGSAPVGWCSWYDLFQQVSARSTQEAAEGFRWLRPRLQLGFFQLDDGYQRMVGDWRPDPRPGKFPGGFAPFVNDAASLGARPGIWVAPLAVHESSPLFHAHPEWMQKDTAGQFVAQVNNWGPVSRWMDPTHPGAREWIRQLLRDLRAQGFTYF